MATNKKTSELKVPAESISQETSPQSGEPIRLPNEELQKVSSTESDAAVGAEQKVDEEQILEKWKNLDVSSLVERGWQYRVKTKRNGKQYMSLRKGKTDRGLGGYTPSKEKLLFQYYPELKEDFMRRHPSGDRRTIHKRGRPFLSVPIKRLAVIPANYRPSLNVIRYYHIFKQNDFPGDFSDFINGTVEDHFVKCNGLLLPVLLEEQEEDGLIKNVQ